MYAACSTDALGFPIPISEAAVQIAQAGFRSVVLNDLPRDSALPLEEMQALLARTGLSPSAFKLSVEFRESKHQFEEEFKAFRAVSDYAERLGIRRCFSFVKPFSQERTYLENFRLHCERLKDVALLLADHGMVLALEFVGPPSLRTHTKYSFIHTLEELLELCAAIGTGNCLPLLDSYHWDLAGQTPEDFRKLSGGGQIGLVHVNDAPAGIARELQEDMVRCLPGETGVLKIQAFMDGIAAAGYDGPVVVEPFSKRLTQMPFEEALRETAASLKKIGVPMERE